MSASISIFSKCIRTTLALLLITCYHALELAILLEALFIQCEGQHQQEEAREGTCRDACKDIIIKLIFLFSLTFDPCMHHWIQTHKRKSSVVFSSHGAFSTLYSFADSALTWTSMLWELWWIYFHSFLFFYWTVATPFSYAVFIALSVY